MSSSKPKSVESSSHRESILLAIADPAERSQYVETHRDSGFVVQEASDGLTCLKNLRAMRFSMVVVEQQSPWGGGDVVVDVMLNDEQTKTVPVVLLDILCVTVT